MGFMGVPIAIIGMACRYPGARSYAELWENVLAGRRAFRRMPAERLRLEDYAPGAGEDTAIACDTVAVLEDYTFDRARFHVSGTQFRSTDLTHWLTLDVATSALADAGVEAAEDALRARTGVFIGNSLTGELSRAQLMRLRWPYVRRTAAAVFGGALADPAAQAAQAARFAAFEQQYKAPFAPVTEESLAGGLSNTIAGRICGFFDFQGAGYTVDGACASSLLAVTTACTQLVAGEIDMAIAGGVDVSLDPFELAGFARLGALAKDDMRVYDVRSDGFWPGEGCGVLVLMRADDAAARGRVPHALIRGWGVSSDGRGSITRPEPAGQLLALERAYARAGYGLDTVGLVEGHGTGTSVGDAVELQALTTARRRAGATDARTAIGSIKANIGHTKAAAGVAGLIKAAMAVRHQIVPPTTGCEEPHALLRGRDARLHAPRGGDIWPHGTPVRAGVSAMGFGGINTHVTIESAAPERRRPLGRSERRLLASAQDGELFLLTASDPLALRADVTRLLAIAPRLSDAELTDLAHTLARVALAADEPTAGRPSWRAALVAGRGRRLAERLDTLLTWIDAGETTRLDIAAGLFLGRASGPPRVGYLFSGQASPAPRTGGLWARRYADVAALYRSAAIPDGPAVSTAVAQPAIVTASLAGLGVLDELGLDASVAVGHSLGELTALHWAGMIDRDALLRLAHERGDLMERLGDVGAMASLRIDAEAAASLLNGGTIGIAAMNARTQTIVSGESSAVESLLARARARGVQATRLAVSRAFHSPLVARAVDPFAARLDDTPFATLDRRIVSTVTGAELPADCDGRALLRRQILAPVRFEQALGVASQGLDLWIEVGPGSVLTGLAAEQGAVPVVAIDAGSESLRGLLAAAGAAFALGARLDVAALCDARFARPFDIATPPRFLSNPCESAPLDGIVSAHALDRGAGPASGDANADTRAETNGATNANAARDTSTDSSTQTSGRSAATAAAAPTSPSAAPSAARSAAAADDVATAAKAASARETLRALIAARTELPLAEIRDELRLLGDLHLSSITVSQIMVEATAMLGCAAPVSPTDYATATIGDAAAALEELRAQGGAPVDAGLPAGLDTWVHSLVDDWIPVEPTRRALVADRSSAWRIVSEPGDPFAQAVARALAAAGGEDGLLLSLPPRPGEDGVDLLLQAAAALLDTRPARVVAVHRGGGGAAGFLRSLFLELAPATLCIVDVPDDSPRSVAWIAAESRTARGFVHTRYDADGIRREPRLRLLDPLRSENACPPLGPDDVLLATGGGKGIGMVCAFALAQAYGAAVAVLGRGDPASDRALAEGLARYDDAGLRCRYYRADVTDAAAVEAAARAVQAEQGAITAVLHAAGWNQPQRLAHLDRAAFDRTLAPKLAGVRHVLQATDPDRLRLLITFGSLIARTGLPGEADYAAANDWLGQAGEAWAAAGTGRRRLLHLDWSVWSGPGMGERLGAIDGLVRQGITPIPIDAGVAALRALLESGAAGRCIVSSRFGSPPTAKLSADSLPLRRFLEEPRVHYPGIELVADIELSALSDPYLADHIVQGEPLFPAVLGLEAMAQAAGALLGREDLPAFEDVQLLRPAVVPESGTLRVRLAALRRGPTAVEVALRTAATNFAVDHFRALCRFGDVATPIAPLDEQALREQAPVALDPARDLYGPLLFHTGRFQRVRGYRHLRAKVCVAELRSETDSWFARHLPTDLLLGDPGARDAAIHCVQACIPHRLLLPVGVERITAARDWPSTVLVHAVERAHEQDEFLYDLDIRAEDGRAIEQWRGLRLRAVAPIAMTDSCPSSLLGPYLERRFEELWPQDEMEVALEAAPDRAARRAQAIRRLTPLSAAVSRRADGRPELTNGHGHLSLAHAEELTLCARAARPLGCDLELVRPRAREAWRDLLGSDRLPLVDLVMRDAGEALDTAATRVWVMAESLKKAGAAVNEPLVLVAAPRDGWVLFQAGQFHGATLDAAGQQAGARLVLGVTARSEDALVRVSAHRRL